MKLKSDLVRESLPEAFDEMICSGFDEEQEHTG